MSTDGVDDCMSDLESANADKNAAAEAYTDAVTLAGQAYSKSKQMKREYEEHVKQQKGDEETAAEIERLRQLMEAAEKDWKTAQSKTDNLHKVYIAKDKGIPERRQRCRNRRDEPDEGEGG